MVLLATGDLSHVPQLWRDDLKKAFPPKERPKPIKLNVASLRIPTPFPSPSNVSTTSESEHISMSHFDFSTTAPPSYNSSTAPSPFHLAPRFSLTNSRASSSIRSRKKALWAGEETKQSHFNWLDLLSQTSESRGTPSKRLPFLETRKWLYNWLQRPAGYLALAYHTTVAIVIVLGLLFFGLASVQDNPSLHQHSTLALKILEIMALSIFTAEFILLFWASSCLGKYRNFGGKLRYLLSPFRLLDLIIIGATAVVVWTLYLPPSQAGLFWPRCFMLLQILRLEHRFKPWRMFRSVIWFERKHLLATAFFAFLLLFVSSYVMYFIEQADPETTFTNIPVSLWWGVVTMLSIGYGDFAPKTTAGRIVTSFMAILGCIAFAILPGIIAAGLALRVQERTRKKQINSRRQPAARLIQTSWRLWLFSRREHYTQIPEAIARQFIAALKFEVARRKFHHALRPYDLRDLMQQYADDHIDVVGRSRTMQGHVKIVQGQMGEVMRQMWCFDGQQQIKLRQIELLAEKAKKLAGSLTKRSLSSSLSYYSTRGSSSNYSGGGDEFENDDDQQTLRGESTSLYSANVLQEQSMVFPFPPPLSSDDSLEQPTTVYHSDDRTNSTHF